MVVLAVVAVRFSSSLWWAVAWALLAALFCVALPYLVLMVLIGTGHVLDRHVVVREQRRAPLAAALACVVVGLALVVLVGCSAAGGGPCRGHAGRSGRDDGGLALVQGVLSPSRRRRGRRRPRARPRMGCRGAPVAGPRGHRLGSLTRRAPYSRPGPGRARRRRVDGWPDLSAPVLIRSSAYRPGAMAVWIDPTRASSRRSGVGRDHEGRFVGLVRGLDVEAARNSAISSRSNSPWRAAVSCWRRSSTWVVWARWASSSRSRASARVWACSARTAARSARCSARAAVSCLRTSSSCSSSCSALPSALAAARSAVSARCRCC